MSHVHLVGGEKGGVGKSVVARVLTQWCIDRGHPFAAADADVSHGTLSRAYAEFSQRIDLTNFSSADEIMDRALAAERRVIVDLPAQSARSLEAWLAAGDVLRFAQDSGIRLTLWHVSDGGFDSVKDLDRVLERFGSALSYVVVRNFGRARDFRQLDESPARRRLDELGGCILDLPELDPATMFAVDECGASLWSAAHRGEGEGILRPMERQRVRRWLEQTYVALDGLGPAI